MTTKAAIRRTIKWAMFWQAWLAVWIIMQIVAGVFYIVDALGLVGSARNPFYRATEVWDGREFRFRRWLNQ